MESSVRTRIGQLSAATCFLDVTPAIRQVMHTKLASIPVEVIDWADEEATEHVRYDVLDLFEDAEEFDPSQMVPFGLVSQTAHSGGTDWDAILLVNVADGSVSLFHVASYTFSTIAASLDGLLRTA